MSPASRSTARPTSASRTPNPGFRSQRPLPVATTVPPRGLPLALPPAARWRSPTLPTRLPRSLSLTAFPHATPPTRRPLSPYCRRGPRLRGPPTTPLSPATPPTTFPTRLPQTTPSFAALRAASTRDSALLPRGIPHLSHGPPRRLTQTSLDAPNFPPLARFFPLDGVLLLFRYSSSDFPPVVISWDGATYTILLEFIRLAK